MKPSNRFSSWENTNEIEDKVTPEPPETEEIPVEPEVAPEQSEAERVFAEVVEADKNRPAVVDCDKETWPEVKKMMIEARIVSRYNHNRIKLN